MVIDKQSKVPLHYQVYLDLLGKIQKGLFKPGSRLLAESELEQAYGVSRITIRAAVSMLEHEGLVEKHRGKKGTIICPFKPIYDIKKLSSFTDDVRLLGQSASSLLLDFRELLPSKHIEMALELERNETVFYLKRKRCREDVVVGVHKAYIKKIAPLDAALFEKPNASLYQVLQGFGIVPSTAFEILEVKPAPEAIARHLGVEKDSAIFYKERLSYFADKQPFEYVEMFYNPRYYRYKVELVLD